MSNTFVRPEPASGSSATIVIIGSAEETSRIEKLCAGAGMSTRVMSQQDAAAAAARADAALAGCTLLIDTREGEGKQRSHLLRELEGALPADAIIAATARHRSVGSLPASLARPSRFGALGLMTASDGRPIVEVIRTPGSSDQTVDSLVQLVGRIDGKSLVVRDAPGFFLTRVTQSFFNEAMALVGEGVAAAQVEQAALENGLPSGPLAVLDEVSLKLSDELLHQELHDLEHGKHEHDHDHHHHAEQAGAGHATIHGEGHGHGSAHDHDHGDVHGEGPGHGHPQADGQGSGGDHDPDHAHDHDHDHDHDRAHDHPHDHKHDHEHAHSHDHDHAEARAPAGAPAGHGHQHAHQHAHTVKSKRMPEPAVYVMEKMAHGFRRMGRDAGAGFYEYEDDGSASLWSGLKAFERRTTKLPAEDIRDRLLFMPALEAIRCLDEEVVGSLADADAALVSLGVFPAAAGGPSAFVDRMGMRTFVERARALADRYGDRFQPPARLIDLASRDQPLTGQPGSATAGAESQGNRANAGSGPKVRGEKPGS